MGGVMMTWFVLSSELGNPHFMKCALKKTNKTHIINTKQDSEHKRGYDPGS